MEKIPDDKTPKAGRGRNLKSHTGEEINSLQEISLKQDGKA